MAEDSLLAEDSSMPETGERSPASALRLRVNDLKQWLYCPRIVFYQYAMPVPSRRTWKMEQGQVAQECLERLEKRRGFARYGLVEARRYFNLWLTSDGLGLSGKLDLLLESAAGLFPVDFKFSMQAPHRNHLMQLAGYALLVEEQWRTCVDRGFIYLTPRHEVVEMRIPPETKEEARQTLARIRNMIERQAVPPPATLRRRCDDCEFRNYCADIF